MGQLQYLEAVLLPGDAMLNADVKDEYYHLRPQPPDQLRLIFIIDGDIYFPLCINCGLSVVPWFSPRRCAP